MKRITKKTVLFILVCMALLLISTRSYSQVNWEIQQLVKNGRIDAIADLGNGIVVAGTREATPGVIFRSTDYGITWESLGEITREKGANEENGILNFMNGTDDYAYLLTTTGQFWRSTDKGLTWKKTTQLAGTDGKRTISYSICVTPLGTVLATTGASIYRSTDNGLNFEQIGPISEEPVYRFEQIGNGIIVNGWAGTVYKSNDDGRTWQYFSKLDTTPLYATEYLGATTFLQASESGNIYKCNQDHPERTKLVAHFDGAADDFVYLRYQSVIYSTYTDERNIYITHDNGENWKNIGPINTGAEGDWLDHVIRLDVQDSIIAIGGTNKGYIARAAFLSEDLYKLSKPKIDDEITNHKNLKNATVSVLTDYLNLNEPEDVLIDGDYAYVPSRVGQNLAVINISNPKEPKIVESFKDIDLKEAMGLTKNGDYIYLTSMANEMCLVIDASDPENLKKIYSFTVGGVNKYPNRLRKVNYKDDYLYFTHDGEGALYIADAKDPKRPEIISNIKFGKGAFAIIIKDNTAYVGGCVGSNELSLIDISDKRNPKLIQTISDSTKYKCICDFEITNDTLHAISYGSNAYIQFDISNPNQIKEIRMFQSDKLNGPGRFVLMNNKVYIINSINNSVAELSIGSEINISKIVSSKLFLKAYGLNQKDGLLYISNRDAMNFVVLDPDKL